MRQISFKAAFKSSPYLYDRLLFFQSGVMIVTSLVAASRQMAVHSPWDLIDLHRYPVRDRTNQEYEQLVTKCREQLGQLGACVLPGFIKGEALEWLRAEALELAPQSYHSTVIGNAYLTPEDTSRPADHPLRLVDRTALGVVAYDQMPPDLLIRRLYEWDGLMEFLCDALSKEKLYRYADQMGALNIAVMKEGDYLRWHFDQTDFVVSLLIQDCKSGGEYEFVPMIRNKNDENFDKVKAVLNGAREGVIKLDIQPGSLVLFEGRNSLHRVTPIEGDVLRLIALLGYDTKPGVVSTEHLRYMRYGRAK